MSAESEKAVRYGLRGPLAWPIGGILGGLVGTAAFGLLVWLASPEVISVTIPGLYGVEGGGTLGWGIHLAHGAILGLVFGFIVTRDAVLAVLLADVETDVIAGSSDLFRIVAAGLAYGLAIWAFLPVLSIPAALGLVDPEAVEEFPALAFEGMIGHVLFGILLGAVFAIVVDVHARSTGRRL